MSVLKDQSLAEDALQEAFFAIARHIDDLGDAESGKTAAFIYTVTERKCLDILRDRKQFAPLGDYPAPETPEEVLPAAFARLSPDHRQVLTLRYVQGYGVWEIAKIMKRSPGAVSMLIKRAKAALKDELEKEGYEVEAYR